MSAKRIRRDFIEVSSTLKRCSTALPNSRKNNPNRRSSSRNASDDHLRASSNKLSSLPRSSIFNFGAHSTAAAKASCNCNESILNNADESKNMASSLSFGITSLLSSRHRFKGIMSKETSSAMSKSSLCS